MSIKRALVVDDSRSARLVLRRLLENHGLDVETAESAEQALDYLQGSWPDVIFMDHTMPGMDGLQAVKVIKNDPKTAMIPVMMYTAKEGELYVGQARALGAVGVLPKHVEAAELFKVLQRLGLVTDQRRDGDESKVSRAPDEGRGHESLQGPGIQLEGLVERMLSEQRHELRTDILASHRVLARQVAQEVISEQRAEQARIAAAREAAEPAAPEPPAPAAGNGRMWFTLLLLACTAWLLWSGNRSADEIARLEQEASDQAAVMETLVADSTAQSRNQIAGLQARLEMAGDQRARMIGALEWAVNQQNGIDYPEEILGGSRLELIQNLLFQLDNLGYKGVVKLETHLGQFCLVGDEARGYKLASPELAVDQCALIGHPLDEIRSVAGRQSLEFINFLDSSELLEAGDIELQIVHHGLEDSRELYAYPRSSGVAADWNAVAARNNRLVITLLPDPAWLSL
ncbi:MAG: response regulator [Pseudomonadales bacterium]|nr:response regulator [Halioglobus sp.]MCP5128764.1 response regulator [Pseudomonadales bacterium]